MAKLKLGTIETDKPVKISIRVPAPIYRNLIAYAQALASATNQPPIQPDKIIPAMLQQFMATDRGFAKYRRERSFTVSEKVP